MPLSQSALVRGATGVAKMGTRRIPLAAGLLQTLGGDPIGGVGTAGGGFLGLGNLRSSWMTYELDGLSAFDGGNFSSRIGHQLDLDMLKTNLARDLTQCSA